MYITIRKQTTDTLKAWLGTSRTLFKSLNKKNLLVPVIRQMIREIKTELKMRNFRKLIAG
jgi:hypothetical protein